MGDLVLWLVVVCLACYLQRMDKPLDFVDGAHVNAGRHWFLNKKGTRWLFIHMVKITGRAS